MAKTLQQQLDDIEAVIASGVDQSSFDGKSSHFRPLSDLLNIRARLRREIGLDPSKSNTVLAAHDRGFGGRPRFGFRE